MKKVVILIFSLFFLSTGYVFAAEQAGMAVNVQNVGVNVKVNKVTNNVDAIQFGDHGSFMPHNDIINRFDSNNNGTVNLNEFNSNLNNGIDWNFSAKKTEFKVGDGYTQEDAEKVLDNIDPAKEYLASNHNYSFTPPSTITLNNDGMGNCGGKDEWNFESLDNVDHAAATKVFQEYLGEVDPDLGYRSIEAEADYLTSDLLGDYDSLADRHTYNSDFDSYNGGTIHQARQDYNSGKITKDELEQIENNTGNNAKAIAETIRDINNDLGRDYGRQLNKRAMSYLENKSNPTGSDWLNAYLNADLDLTGGQNTTTISNHFFDHGIC